MRPHLSTAALASLCAPLLALSAHCGGGKASASSSSSSFPPIGDGGFVDDSSALADADGFAPDPFTDAAAPDAFVGADASCDDTQGDLSACDALVDGGSGGTCLSASICARLVQILVPRPAGLAMDCIDALPADCIPGAVGDCVVTTADLACQVAAAGTPPCDAAATLCAAGDPFGLVDQCLAMATALTPSAASSLGACLAAASACDPEALSGCATQLFP